MKFMYHHGYAIPDYVRSEPKIPRGGTYTTKQMPRGTYDATLSGDFDLDLDDDPIASFGEGVASVIMAEIGRTPPAQRTELLNALLNRIDPKLAPRISQIGKQLEAQGIPSATALRRAISSAASTGLVEEFARAGSTGVISPVGFVGLAAYGPSPMDGILSTITSPIKWVVKKGAGSKVTQQVGNAVSSISDLACRVAGTSVGQQAAGAYGGPAAAGGAAMLAKTCSGPAPVPVQPQQSSMMLPLMIGGVALVAILLIATSKKGS